MMIYRHDEDKSGTWIDPCAGGVGEGALDRGKL